MPLRTPQANFCERSRRLLPDPAQQDSFYYSNLRPSLSLLPQHGMRSSVPTIDLFPPWSSGDVLFAAAGAGASLESYPFLFLQSHPSPRAIPVPCGYFLVGMRQEILYFCHAFIIAKLRFSSSWSFSPFTPTTDYSLFWFWIVAF